MSSTVSLAPCLAEPIAEVFEDKIDGLIIAWRHDRGGLFGSTHDATPHRGHPRQETEARSRPL